MRERQLLQSVRHIALATVNEDGTPHNTPLFFAINDTFDRLYFVSREASLHSQNFLKSGNAFAVMYDSNDFNGGLYITIKNGRLAAGTELQAGLSIFNQKCKAVDNDALPRNYHLIKNGYRLFIGDITKIEKYQSIDDENGKLKEEARMIVSVEEIVND